MYTSHSHEELQLLEPKTMRKSAEKHIQSRGNRLPYAGNRLPKVSVYRLQILLDVIDYINMVIDYHV